MLKIAYYINTYIKSFFTALAVYTRSPAAYRALRQFKLLNLPHQNTLKSYTRVNSHKPGIHWDYLFKQYELYEKHKERIAHLQRPVPNGYGALIFDEVKVNNHEIKPGK